jgi:hypothetical protein
MRHVRRRRRRRRRHRLECRSRRIHTRFTLRGGGWWNHSTVTARADADQSRRGCWIPGIPPCWRGSSFSKQPPPSQPLSLEGSKPSMKPGARGQGPGVRGLTRGPMPQYEVPAAFGLNGTTPRGSRMKTGAKACHAVRHPPSAIRHSPSVRSSAPYAYCVLTGAAGPSGP